MSKKVTLADIEVATKYGWSLVGIPYKLGGNVPQDGGLDCSGFVLELLRTCGAWGLSDATAQNIYDGLKAAGYPYSADRLQTYSIDVIGCEEGEILFFGKDTKSITHVAWALNGRHMLEAGGNDKTGMVRPRRVDWRKDLVASVRLV